MTRKRTNPSSRRFRPRNVSRSHLEVGTQELTQITLGTPSGTFVGGQIPLIPTFEPGSRLSRLAVQFSQYTIEHSRVKFVSQANTNTSGRIAMAWTFDPLESAPVNVHQILQVSASRLSPLWKNITTAMPRRSPDKRRFPVIEGPQFTALDTVDKLMYLPGTLIFGSDGSAQSGLVVGSLIWHYRIRFFNPNLVIGAELTSFETIQEPTISRTVPSFSQLTVVEEEEEPLQV